MSDEAGIVNVPVKQPPAHWRRTQAPPKATGWRYQSFYVLSRVALVTRASGARQIVWYLAISKGGRGSGYPTIRDVNRVLSEFDMVGAEETTNAPEDRARMRWRHFVMPVPTEPEPEPASEPS